MQTLQQKHGNRLPKPIRVTLDLMGMRVSFELTRYEHLPLFSRMVNNIYNDAKSLNEDVKWRLGMDSDTWFLVNVARGRLPLTLTLYYDRNTGNILHVPAGQNIGRVYIKDPLLRKDFKGHYSQELWRRLRYVLFGIDWRGEQ